MAHTTTARRLLILALVAIAAAGTTGCSGSARMQRVMLQKGLEYETHPTDYNLTDLAHCYGEMLVAQKDDTIRPGFFADYGVALARLGKNSEANRMFNNEIMLYPNAARYVRQLKLQLVPEYLSDTISDTSTIYVIALDPKDDGSQVRETELASDSVKMAREQQRMQRERQKWERQQAQQAAAEEHDLMKSIRAREKEQRDQVRTAEKASKEEAKKEAAKAKKEAKKEAEKAKKEAKKEAEKAKKEAAKQKEQNRKEAQERRQAEREERARQREAERQARQQATEQGDEE